MIYQSQHIRFVLGVFLCAFPCSLAVPAHALPQSICYQKLWLASIPVHVVTVDLNDADVRLSPVMPRWGLGHAEGWGAMLGRVHPTAAITGTFFDTRSNLPTGDILVDGNLICRGVTGTALCMGQDNHVTFIPMGRGECLDWTGYQHVLVAGPALISGGRIILSPRDQGFRDRRMYAKRPRTAVGLTKLGKFVMVAVTRPVHLGRLAKAMRALGVTDAAALDGGGSTALYYRGKSVASPVRRLTNLLVAYDSSARYEQFRSMVAPMSTRIAERP